MKAIIRGENFNGLVKASKRFTSKDSTHILHEWIRLEFSKQFQSVKAVAADGYRMSTENSLCDYVEDDFCIYVKPDMQKVSRRESITIELNGKKAFIHDGDSIIGFVQPQGDFIDYKKVLSGVESRDITNKILFNADLLIEALQSAKVSCGGVFRQPVAIEFRGNLDPIIIRTGDNNIKLVLPVRS